MCDKNNLVYIHIYIRVQEILTVSDQGVSLILWKPFVMVDVCRVVTLDTRCLQTALEQQLLHTSISSSAYAM